MHILVVFYPVDWLLQREKGICMKTKIFVSLAAIALGIVLLGYGFYGKSRQVGAREDINSASSWIDNKQAKGLFEGGMNSKVNEYNTPITLCFVGGTIFLIGGVIGVYRCRKKLGNKE